MTHQGAGPVKILIFICPRKKAVVSRQSPFDERHFPLTFPTIIHAHFTLVAAVMFAGGTATLLTRLLGRANVVRVG